MQNKNYSMGFLRREASGTIMGPSSGLLGQVQKEKVSRAAEPRGMQKLSVDRRRRPGETLLRREFDNGVGEGRSGTGEVGARHSDVGNRDRERLLRAAQRTLRSEE